MIPCPACHKSDKVIEVGTPGVNGQIYYCERCQALPFHEGTVSIEMKKAKTRSGRVIEGMKKIT